MYIYHSSTWVTWPSFAIPCSLECPGKQSLQQLPKCASLNLYIVIPQLLYETCFHPKRSHFNMIYGWKHSLVSLFVCFVFVLITFCLFPSPIAELGNPGYRSWPFCHQKLWTWCLLASGWCDAAGVACCCFLNASEKAVNGHFLFTFSTLNCFYKSQSNGTSTSSWESALQGSVCCSCTDDGQVITLFLPHKLSCRCAKDLSGCSWCKGSARRCHQQDRCQSAQRPIATRCFPLPGIHWWWEHSLKARVYLKFLLPPPQTPVCAVHPSLTWKSNALYLRGRGASVQRHTAGLVSIYLYRI